MNWTSSLAAAAVLAIATAGQPAPAMAQSAGGGQTKANESAWTVDTLKSYYDAVLAKDAEILALHKEMAEMQSRHSSELRDAADKRYEQRFQAQEVAAVKATANQNEFRGSLNDLSLMKVPRTEFEAANKSNEVRLAEMQRRLDIKEGSSSGIGYFIGVALSIIASIVAVVGLVWMFATRRKSSA